MKAPKPGLNGRDSARDHPAIQVDEAYSRIRQDQFEATTTSAAQSNQHTESVDFALLESREQLVHPFNKPAPRGHVAVFDHSTNNDMSRPRAGRGGTGRETRDGDVETDYLNRVIEAVKKAKEHNDNCQRLGSQIIELEAEIKAKGCEYNNPTCYFAIKDPSNTLKHQHQNNIAD